MRVDAAVARLNDLRPGSAIIGQAAETRSGNVVLMSVDTVDGMEPDAAKAVKLLRNQTTIDPTEQIVLEDSGGDVTLRAIDLIAPLGRGQRCLVVAPPRSGKTVLLEKIAKRIDADYPDVELLVLLVNERPEEATHFRRLISRGTVYVSTADELNARHVHLTEMVGAHARRLTETGKHVMLIVDSLTRIGRAYNAVQAGGGRTLSGGLDARAMERPKAFFGAARNIEDGGSLTIIATALIDTGSRMDEVIFEEFKGTGNMELVLDRSLADRRVFPAIDVQKSGTRREERILDPVMLKITHLLRKVLMNMKSGEATPLLVKKLEATSSNQEFLRSFRIDDIDDD